MPKSSALILFLAIAGCGSDTGSTNGTNGTNSTNGATNSTNGGTTGGPAGVTCDPNLYPDPCDPNVVCDAITKKCVSATTCSDHTPCNGYTCTISSICVRNCRGATGPDDNFCDTGYKCSTANACVKVTTCDPKLTNPCNGTQCDATDKTCKQGTACTDDVPCGSYTCTMGGFCNLSCNSATQCKVGKTCNMTTGACE
jgi:hypothetical protein